MVRHKSVKFILNSFTAYPRGIHLITIENQTVRLKLGLVWIKQFLFVVKKSPVDNLRLVSGKVATNSQLNFQKQFSNFIRG
jgi:hypothetical protein